MIKKILLIMGILCSLSASATEKPFINEFTIGFYFPSINAVVSRTDFHIAIDMWIKEFKYAVNINKTNVKLFDQMEKMKSAFNNGELDLIIAPPLLIVNHLDLNTLSDGFAGTSTTGEPYDIVVLARNDSKISSINDVKDKRLVLPENDELAKVFINSLLVPIYHQPYSQVFRSTLFSAKQNNIIHQLFFDKADVGIAFLETFNLMAELNPQIRDKIKILNSFPINSPNYCFFHYQFPDKIRKHLIARALELNNSIRSKEILSNFKMATITACPVESLTPFITLKKQNKLLEKLLEKQ